MEEQNLASDHERRIVAGEDEHGGDKVVVVNADEDGDEDDGRVRGWKMDMLTLGYVSSSIFQSEVVDESQHLALALPLHSRTTIVSTSLVSITSALEGFAIRDWLVTSYLITYTGTFLHVTVWY